jgi:muramoyltetrapeptide carboxypeptidase
MANFDQSIIKPKRLAPGDTIGIAAPAGPYKNDEFEKGIAAIREMGFQVKIPENLQQPKSFLAASDEHRASLLMDLFRDPKVDAIVCARGGYGSLRILERLDFDVIRGHPKAFVGFSDISALHEAFMTRSGLIVFHGPMVISLGKSSSQTKTSLLEALTIDQPIEIHATKPNQLYPGTPSGIVSGGNLATICHLLGTPFTPIYKGAILLLEDITEAPYKIDRMLFQMKMAGCFNGIKGVVLGRFQDSGRYQEICEIVREIFEEFKVPVLVGFEIGHNQTNLTIPLGLMATLDTENGSLVFHEPATSP